MQVRYDEGVANHIGLEPCAVAREGGGEASVEEHTGQPLSLAKILIPGADAVANAEGNTGGRVNASTQTARRGRRTWHVWKLAAGNREIPRLTRRNKQLWYASGR